MMSLPFWVSSRTTRAIGESMKAPAWSTLRSISCLVGFDPVVRLGVPDVCLHGRDEESHDAPAALGLLVDDVFE